MKELEMQNMTVKRQPLESGVHFDITKHIRLVPPFQEKEVDKYFLHFEKVAENLKWPKEHWTLLLQSVIIGKAREIYTQLTFIHKMKNKNQRLLRWSLLLQEYNLDIRHIRGKDNIIPDALSRA